MSDWRHVRTRRLWLDEPVDGDADDLFAIHSDPASWRHFPSGRVTDPSAGTTMVGASRRRFERDGLAFLVEHNVASRKTAEKVGLRLVWRGPDDGNPDPDAVRLVFLDREPDDLFVAEVASEGWAPERFLR